ncbi:MAG: hypothetical protein PHT84_05700 [Candidatus Pacebacteria bacterium]|jgi:hypothetical protein|nr:hypothetical protein [Candidatus Paceibacterota bacterium]
MRGVTNTDWSISHGDWIGFEGTAIASCLISNGTTEVFVWQWDAAWPHALALTPNTVTIFPLMDPGVKLTSDGRTALWSGRGAIEEYFEKE